MDISHNYPLNLIFLLCASGALSACGNKNQIDSEISTEFGRILKDPVSMQLRSVTYFKDGTACGEFNSKNENGGYVGFEKFIYQKGGVIAGKEYTYIRSTKPAELIIKYSSQAVAKFPRYPLVFGDAENSISEATIANWCRDGATYEEKIKAGRLSYLDEVLSRFDSSQLKSMQEMCELKKRKKDLYIQTDRPTVSEMSRLSVDAEWSCRDSVDARALADTAASVRTELSSIAQKPR